MTLRKSKHQTGSRWQARLVWLLGLLVIPVALANDKDLIGYELYERKDYGSAAEVFEDTAWRGVSLYRSDQWWRAAEAFVRGNDAGSFFNLGNTYVKMGYYALALEAYQQALQIEPDHEDAIFNAEIMNQVLALRENQEEGEGLLQPESLGELDTENDDSEGSSAADGGEKSERLDGEPEKTDSEGDQTTSESGVEAESGSAALSDDSDEESDSGDQGSSSVTGIERDDSSAQNAAGNSNSMSEAGDAQSAGIRTEIEAEQATEQWLNRIQHDPILFLKRHIELETQRRVKAGQQAPEGGDGW